MKNERGQVKSECFYRSEGKDGFSFINGDDESLNNFLKDVSYVDAQIISAANILVLFYTK
ncbi:hypothetical protein ES705_09353 [subsurface metagenome]